MPHSASTHDTGPTAETLAELDIDPDEWQACREHLEAVSRTFSTPIGMLPDVLSIASTCGYLLCRIADTIEDHPDLNYDQRDDLFDRFLTVLESDASADHFTEPARNLPGDGPYLDLSRELDRVLNVFFKLPDEFVECSKKWVGEMSHGMRLYVRRAASSSGLTTLETVRDLERYCYFVAGTVGHLLTALFVNFMDAAGTSNRTNSPQTSRTDQRVMRANAEEFGLGLQLVNILKDQTDDLDRGWCYIPHTIAERVDLQPHELYESANRQAAHEAVAPLFDRASDHLDSALDYILAMPADQSAMRIACLLPLWMAVRTLVHARGNDAMFETGAPVKISRTEVGAIIQDCSQNAGNDRYLRDRYASLWQPSAPLTEN